MKKSFLQKKNSFKSCFPLVLASAVILTNSSIAQALSCKFTYAPGITTQQIVAIETVGLIWSDYISDLALQTANFNQPKNFQAVSESDSTTGLLALSIFGLGTFLKEKSNESE
jgi:hypothetical protein